LGGLYAHLVDAERQEEHQTQRREQRHPAQHRQRHAALRRDLEEQRAHRRDVGHQPRADAGQDQTGEHVVVDPEHVRPETGVVEVRRRRGGAKHPIVVVSHNSKILLAGALAGDPCNIGCIAPHIKAAMKALVKGFCMTNQQDKSWPYPPLPQGWIVESYGLRSWADGLAASATQEPTKPMASVTAQPPTMVSRAACGSNTKGTSNACLVTTDAAKVPTPSARMPVTTPSNPYSSA